MTEFKGKAKDVVDFIRTEYIPNEVLLVRIERW